MNESSKKVELRRLREWRVTSPPALEVAHALNELLESWAAFFVDKVGLVEDRSVST